MFQAELLRDEEGQQTYGLLWYNYDEPNVVYEGNKTEVLEFLCALLGQEAAA